jgi:cobalt-precorrin 5A hydrolase
VNPSQEPSLGIWLVRGATEPLGEHLAQQLGARLYRPWLTPEVSQAQQFAAQFPAHAQWVLVGAAGIALRFLQGLVRDKHSDPALVLLDEAARFAVSLLGGHEAGANRLSYRVANACGAVPVVTTATEAVKPLVLGIGCRRGVSAERIEAAVWLALGERSIEQVREVATVDLKADEPGLLAFCAIHDLPLRVLSHQSLAARGWTTAPSEWVRAQVGLDGVCEPCALIASPRGRLVVPKTTQDGVAVAIASDEWLQQEWVN